MGATYSALYSAVYGVDQDTKKPFDIDSLKKELNVRHAVLYLTHDSKPFHVLLSASSEKCKWFSASGD